MKDQNRDQRQLLFISTKTHNNGAPSSGCNIVKLLTGLLLHRKIVDAFIFNNEIEILKIRLFELYDIVDYFILVEGNLTFTGNKKPLYYNENKEKLIN